ncbi:hypothetical protein AAHA92_20601 [Salvia divinorum]|uniref:Uncharacterized protein n=1 Tax=Salvia divinorum TaxID=28513 RepID=A0ABD1GI42_SALDI
MACPIHQFPAYMLAIRFLMQVGLAVSQYLVSWFNGTKSSGSEGPPGTLFNQERLVILILSAYPIILLTPHIPCY